MEPDVRYFILCDDVRTDPNNLLRLDVLGLMTRMRSTSDPPFPMVRPIFRVLIVLEGAAGAVEVSLRITQVDTGGVVYSSQPRPMKFAGGSQEVTGFVFRVENCSFPAAGLYWVECLWSGQVIARQELKIVGK